MPVQFQNSDNFEVDGKWARCKICSAQNEGWQKIGNLVAHEKLASHARALEEVIEDALRAYDTPIVGIPGSSDQNYYSNNDWSHLEDETDDSHPSQLPPALSARSLAILQAAISGEPGFDAGDEEPDEFLRTLVQSIRGDPILGAPMAEWSAGEEVPALEAADDIDFDVSSGLLDLDNHGDNLSNLGPGVTFGDLDGDAEFFPFPSGEMMHTDILFNSPRLRFSREQKLAVLAWGKALGATNVPSLYAIERLQQVAREALGNPTEKVTSAAGNVFYINNPVKLIGKDYANIDLCKKMRSYPEVTENSVNEVWQAEKWLYDVPDTVLKPMIRNEIGKDFYIFELTLCADQQWFIPERFFDMKGARWAVGRLAKQSQAGLVVQEERSMKECSSFHLNWPEIEASMSVTFAPCSSMYEQRMPNQDRIIAGGLEWECPPIIPFIDDVSGNSTKQWNVHYSSYASNAALPRSEIEKEVNIHFVVTSPHASPMELLQAICNAIKETTSGKPLKVWHALRGCFILLRPWILLLPGDNPMQAELCSHVGLNGNFFCRCCDAGGTKEYKASNEGFSKLMSAGALRDSTETRRQVLVQLQMAAKAAAAGPLKKVMTATGVKDSLSAPVISKLLRIGKALRRASEERGAMPVADVNRILADELRKYNQEDLLNPLLSILGLNPHKDTPVEALHTHLLGVVKYFWAQTIWILERNGKFPTFQARLNSLSRAGLKIPNIMADYMCRYRGGLIGKHFKTISQIMIFALHDLVDTDVRNAWMAIGRLTVLIWETNIQDLAAFTADLESTITDVMDFAAKCSPGLLVSKPKFHILLHLPFHIRRFGPALLFSTERYESFNRIFRLCSIYSNRLAPSRDIATTFADLERCRHIMTGGYWFDSRRGQWVCASERVRHHLKKSVREASLLGLSAPNPPSPGRVTLPPLQRSSTGGSSLPRPPMALWSQTMAGQVHSQCPYPDINESGTWNKAESIVTLTGDNAHIGDIIICRVEGGQFSPRGFARIIEILCDESRKSALVTINIFSLGATLHSHIPMPTLSESPSCRVLKPSDVICVINVQHDCFAGKCQATGFEFMRQEREETTQTRSIVQHTDTKNFIINMHALHNHSHIRLTIPPALLQPPDPEPDRVSLRHKAAASLRDQKLQKKIANEGRSRKAAEGTRQARTTQLDDLEVVLEDTSAIPGAADDPSGVDIEGFGSMPSAPLLAPAEMLTLSIIQPPPPRVGREDGRLGCHKVVHLGLWIAQNRALQRHQPSQLLSVQW